MIAPDKIIAEAKRKEPENQEFRMYLKMHADEEELDRQFLRLHQELFADYDCSKCGNCCREYYGTIPENDISRDASYLGITEDQFIDFFLEWDPLEHEYSTKHKPCDFYQEDGTCRLGNYKPESCKEYPYTDQPERAWSLLSVLEAVSVCPVAFEIYERLKEEYDFKK